MPEPGPDHAVLASVHAWASSGAMALTGWPDGPGLGPPEPLVPRLQAVAELLEQRSVALGRAVAVDPLALLTERAAAMGLRRRGRTSCGGAARLLSAVDGWLAVSLARDDDVDLVPAWLSLDGEPSDAWDAVERTVRDRPVGELVAGGAALGLPVAALPDLGAAGEATDPVLAGLPVSSQWLGDAAPARSVDGLVVVDLSSLWAGPLCGSLLADAGATVVKVESTGRPDGARHGNRDVFDQLNAGKRSVALDLTTTAGAHTLGRLVMAADVVIEASRPRALEQLGIDAYRAVADGPRVWISITAHGRDGWGRDRVGFGDDAAVAGGLVAWDADGPCFCADAVADPATGLVAAAAALIALDAGGRWLLDVNLAGVAAHLAGPTLEIPPGTAEGEPTTRPVRGTAPALGADTAAVLAELGVAP